MRIHILISFLMLFFSGKATAQINHIGSLSGSQHKYVQAGQDYTFHFDISTNNQYNDIAGVVKDFSAQVIITNIHDDGLSEPAQQIIISCLPLYFSGKKLRYECTIPGNSLSSGRYEIEIEITESLTNTRFLLSDFNQAKHTISCGTSGFINAALHYQINEHLSYDYAILQSVKSLPEIPSELGGIYSHGFCRNEQISLSDVQVQIWQLEGLQNTRLNLFYKTSRDSEFKILELTHSKTGAEGDALSDYFQDQMIIENGFTSEHLFSLENITEDLLALVDFEPGEHIFELYFELTGDGIDHRLPAGNTNFTYALKVDEAPVGADCQAALLPIELLDFLVINEDKQVYLKWISAIEINNQYYFVERSNDAEQWKIIHEVYGQGNSTEYVSYEFLDKYPLPGINYYRLKQRDFDGALSFSKVKTVRIHDSSITLFPNPVRDYLFYSIKDPNQRYYVKIYDQLGACIFESTIPDPAAKLHQIDLSFASPGVYIIKYINSDNLISKTSEFIKS